MLYVSIQRLPNRLNAHTGESVALSVWLAIFLYDIGHIPRLPGRQNTRQGSHTQTRPHSHLLAYSRMLLPCNTHCLLKWRCHRMGMVNICLRMALCHCRYSSQFQKNEYAQLLRDYMLRTYGINYLGSIQANLRLRWLRCGRMGYCRRHQLHIRGCTLQHTQGTLYAYRFSYSHYPGRHIPYGSCMEYTIDICHITISHRELKQYVC